MPCDSVNGGREWQGVRGKRRDREWEEERKRERGKDRNIKERTNELKKCIFEGNGISNRQYIPSVFLHPALVSERGREKENQTERGREREDQRVRGREGRSESAR